MAVLLVASFAACGSDSDGLVIDVPEGGFVAGTFEGAWIINLQGEIPLYIVFGTDGLQITDFGSINENLPIADPVSAIDSATGAFTWDFIGEQMDGYLYGSLSSATSGTLTSYEDSKGGTFPFVGTITKVSDVSACEASWNVTLAETLDLTPPTHTAYITVDAEGQLSYWSSGSILGPATGAVYCEGTTMAGFFRTSEEPLTANTEIKIGGTLSAGDYSGDYGNDSTGDVAGTFTMTFSVPD